MTITIPSSELSVSGNYSRRVMMADSDTDEHLLMSVAANRWAPHLDLDFASDGAEMLLKLALTDSVDELPSAIVLNRYMDRYDGLRTLCEMQSHPTLWQIPVVVILDWDDIRAEIDCYRTGAKWVQSKPQNLREVKDFFERIDTFSAPAFSYHNGGSWDPPSFARRHPSHIASSVYAESEEPYGTLRKGRASDVV